MNFKSLAQKECFERVSVMMKEIFGERAFVHADEPVILAKEGSALAMVVVGAWGDDDAVIKTRCYVVQGARLDENLKTFLLRENADMRFGGFAIDDDGNIIFQHGIAGADCCKDELKASVLSTLFLADEYDDKIVSRWGGRRALDGIG